MSAPRQIALIVGLAAVYFVAGKLGLQFGSLHANASAVWPPTGVSIAALILAGYKVWPGIFAGALLVNVTTAGSLATSLGIATGNTLEAVCAAWLVNRFAGGRTVFQSAPTIFKFAALAAVLSTTISATIGPTSLALGGYATLQQFPKIWLTWWLGDAAGALIVTPLLMLWFLDWPTRWTARWAAETALLFAVTGIVGAFVFSGDNYPFAFLCLPPLAWAAFRLGQREVAAAVAILAVLSTFATVRGHGPFVMDTANESLLALYAFLATISMMALPTAAVVRERAELFARERVARAQAEEATLAKDQFLAMLSHELRNPLNTITMATEVLGVTGHEQSAHWRSVIKRQTEHLTELIGDLLDIARTTGGKMALGLEKVDVAAVAARCLEDFRETGALAQHEVQLDLEPVWVNADPLRLEQIFRNLLSNAAKYTPEQGLICLRVRPRGEHAVICVEDTGIGISAEFLPRVFDFFTQAPQGLDRAAGGLGIGLSLVRRLVELHDGRIEAHSAGPGQGSSFVIHLPRIEPQAAASDEPTEHGERAVQRILIVEDNPATREALRRLLEAAGHDTYEAVDGEAGLEAAARLQPDAAVVDIGLPGISGYEVAKRLRALLPDIRLIAATGYGQDADRQRVEDAGFDAHLLKPIDFEQLDAVLAQTLGAASLSRTAS